MILGVVLAGGQATRFGSDKALAELGERGVQDLAQRLLTAAVGMRDQRANDDTAVDRRAERLLQLGLIEAEDGDVDGFLGFADGAHDRREAVLGLNDQFH